MVTIAAPLLFMALGGVVYFASKNGKVAELGRMTFLAGVLVLAYLLGSHPIHF